MLGVRYMSRVGYDPEASATFLRALAGHGALERELAGREGRDVFEDFFATHPRPRTACARPSRRRGERGAGRRAPKTRPFPGDGRGTALRERSRAGPGAWARVRSSRAGLRLHGAARLPSAQYPGRRVREGTGGRADPVRRREGTDGGRRRVVPSADVGARTRAERRGAHPDKRHGGGDRPARRSGRGTGSRN